MEREGEMSRKYDYLVVGTGLFGAVFAQQMIEKRKSCLVIDRRNHIGGNIYTETISGIQVHRYGAHVFHTSSKEVWGYINRFAEFNNYINAPIARYGDEVYNLPFNMNTFSKMWGVITPEQAKEQIRRQGKLCIEEPKNLEEQALKLVGIDIYEKLIKGYTEKQWGRQCKDLPAFIIRRLPLRFMYDNSYFSDTFQGIPIGGYTPIIKKMLGGCDVLLSTDFFAFHKENPDIAAKTVYTGCIDEYFEWCFGLLEYRSLHFETDEMPIENYQGNAVVNYTHKDVPYTRIIEHKHFEFGKQPVTIISREYSLPWQKGNEPYYPVNDEKNNGLFKKYTQLAKTRKDVLFGGRLAEYQYYDMDQVIARALKMAGAELH